MWLENLVTDVLRVPQLITLFTSAIFYNIFQKTAGKFSLQTLTKIKVEKTESGVEFCRLTAVNQDVNRDFRRDLEQDYLVTLPFVLQPYTSALMQAMPYTFHSNALILITRAMIAWSSLFVTTELPLLFPFNAYGILSKCPQLGFYFLLKILPTGLPTPLLTKFCLSH